MASRPFKRCRSRKGKMLCNEPLDHAGIHIHKQGRGFHTWS